MAKQQQKMLVGKGNVEDFLKGQKMFMMLAEMLSGKRKIVAHPAWASTVTEEQKMRVEMERMKQIRDSDGNKIDCSTEYEAMLYLMTWSLAAPIGEQWTRIYSYLFKKFYPEQSKAIGAHKYETELRDLMDLPELERLKRWIYKQSIK